MHLVARLTIHIRTMRAHSASRILQSDRQTVRRLTILQRMCTVYASHFILGVLVRRAI